MACYNKQQARSYPTYIDIVAARFTCQVHTNSIMYTNTTIAYSYNIIIVKEKQYTLIVIRDIIYCVPTYK